jgi:hypothetical protein
MKKIMALVLVSFALISCGDTGSSQHGFLASGNTGVAFIQFVENNGQLSGQMQGIDIMNGQAHPYNETLTGTLNNGQISLSVSMFGIAETLTGTYDGSTLTLNFPDSSGHLVSSTFQSATIDDYNKAVNSFEASIQATQTATQNAEATAAVIGATATAVSDEQQRLQNDLHNIGGAIRQLQTDTDFSNILKQYSDDINQMQKDYQTEQNDANGGCANVGQVGIDDNTVGIDHNTIGIDDNSFQIDMNSAQNDIANVTDFVQKIQQHWNNLGKQSPGVAQSDIDNAVNNGNDALKQANANISDAKSKTSQYDSQANSINQQADALYNGMHC